VNGIETHILVREERGEKHRHTHRERERRVQYLYDLGDVARVDAALDADPAALLQLVLFGRDLQDVRHLVDGHQLHLPRDEVVQAVDRRPHVRFLLGLYVDGAVQVVRRDGRLYQQSPVRLRLQVHELLH
jgi:hypothetical protein